MKKDLVILLHGIARTSRSMRTIEKALVKHGYHVLNIDYPSRKMTISRLSAYVFAQIKAHNIDETTTLHFVSYSMGCLVLRELLANHPINVKGKIIFLGPPNHGSEVADFLKNYFLYRWIYGPAGQELTTTHAKKKPFAPMRHPFGVIAGSLCLDPICYFMLPKPHDGKVSVRSTKLVGMVDHFTLSTSHTFMISSKKVIGYILHFLETGKFN